MSQAIVQRAGGRCAPLVMHSAVVRRKSCIPILSPFLREKWMRGPSYRWRQRKECVLGTDHQPRSSTDSTYNRSSPTRPALAFVHTVPLLRGARFGVNGTRALPDCVCNPVHWCMRRCVFARLGCSPFTLVRSPLR